MNARYLLSLVAIGALGVAASTPASASTMTQSGNFSTDDQVYTYAFSTGTTQTYSFSTTSYAAGGFNPVLTLFTASGSPVDNFGSGTSDAILSDTLDAGSYLLTLTEFPNVAIGKYGEGFLFAGSPSITGDTCGVPGGMFYDVITCTPRTGAYTLNLVTQSPASVTPEPSSLLLSLPGVALLAASVRRRLQF